MSIVVGYDAIGANVNSLPRGAQVAGYTTGSGPVPWTAAQFAAHPGAVRIDQDPAASDPTADVLDVEAGAATPADCPVWAKRAIRDFDSVARAGQRWPAIYASTSNLPAVANALIAGGVNSGVFLWVANWSLSEAQGIALITNAGGPFPVMGVQFKSGGSFDTNVWSGDWLGNVSKAAPAGPFPHFTTAGQTLGQVASSRGMKPLSWLALQGKIAPDDAANLAGDAVAKTHSRWWSRTP